MATTATMPRPKSRTDRNTGVRYHDYFEAWVVYDIATNGALETLPGGPFAGNRFASRRAATAAMKALFAASPLAEEGRALRARLAVGEPPAAREALVLRDSDGSLEGVATFADGYRCGWRSVWEPTGRHWVEYRPLPDAE